MSTKILLCPVNVRRAWATNFATLWLTNISYALRNDPSAETDFGNLQFYFP